MDSAQAPMSALEEGEFINDRYAKIEERLSVSIGRNTYVISYTMGFGDMLFLFTERMCAPAGCAQASEPPVDVRREGELVGGSRTTKICIRRAS